MTQATVTIRLVSGDWFWITGRGAVATIKPSVWPFAPTELLNQEVEIDGKRFRVMGVERFATVWRPGSNEAIGLLVEPVDPNDDVVTSRFGPGRRYEDVLAANP